jgi:hypothetical protein
MESLERYFTVEEANALLPQIERILERTAELYEGVSTLFSELSAQGFAPREEDGSPDDPLEVQEKRTRLRDLAAELQGTIDEVNGLGCVLKDIESGLVDFLSRRGGRTVYLCWRRGEPEIGWWHDLEAGYQGRRPIFAADEFEGSYLH